ncbi:MAG: hypothetical protein M3258_03060 [Thermoproteota archaeon]|jgi:hypothetical protein|nr:hypothetical protein [Thermoproteota archaeon]
MDVSYLQEETKLDSKLEKLLDQFEREVEPYDRFSGFSMFATPVGIVLSIFLPLAYLEFVSAVNPFVLMVSSGFMYWIVGGILATVCLTKLPIFYADRKKHEISRTKYRPIAGVCMCDLSQLRSHMRKMEKAKATGERMMHAKLVKYYKQQIGWE